MIDTHATEKSGRRRIFFGWYMVAASIVTNTIFSAAYFQGFGVLIIPIERTFGWDRWVISAAMSLRQLESGIVSPAVGFLLDRFSARKLIFWSAVISGVGFIGLGFTTGIVTFFLFFVVISLGASGVSHAVTWPVIISRWFRRNRGLATGLAVTGPIFGSPLVILNTQIEEAYGWRAVLFGYGTLVLVGVTLLSTLVRDRPEPYGLRPDGDPPEEGASTEHSNRPIAPPNGRRADAPRGVPHQGVLAIHELLVGDLRGKLRGPGPHDSLLPARHRTHRGLGGRGHVLCLHPQRYRTHRRRLSAGQDGLSPRPGSRRRDDGLFAVVPPDGGKSKRSGPHCLSRWVSASASAALFPCAAPSAASCSAPGPSEESWAFCREGRLRRESSAR